MSLVHEALQKAEREKQRKAAAAPSAPAAPSMPLGQATPVYSPRSAEPLPLAAHEAVTRKPAPAVEAPPRTNQLLLPVLIGCVAIVAMIAIVFLVSNATSTLRQSKEASPAPATVVSAPAAKLPEPPAPRRAMQASLEPAAVPSVPPPVTSTGDESKYKLSGIMKDPDGKYVAVLNGRVAYEGSYIDGATVKRIEDNHITIDVSGREQDLRFNR